MRRIRLAVRVTYHPDAGGTRRMGEVFDVSDDLGEHWVRGSIAHDAEGEDLTPPIVPVQPISAGFWPEAPTLDTATLSGAVLNSDDISGLSGTIQDSPSMLGEVGPLRQRRGRR